MSTVPNIEGGEVRGAKHVQGTVFPLIQTLGATLTMSADMPNWLWLDPGGASRTVTLPAEAAGLWFNIVNAGSSGELLTINNDGGTTIAIINAGQIANLVCMNGTWYVGVASAAGSGGGPIAVPDAATYTILAANTGRLHVLPDLTADITITMPAEAAGLEFEFIYGGAAADAQDWLFDTGSDTNYFVGGGVHLDADAGTGADEVIPIASDGNSNSKMTVLTPDVGTRVKLVCNGTLWYVNALIVSASAAALAFADQV